MKPQKEKFNLFDLFRKKEIIEIKETINKHPQSLKKESMNFDLINFVDGDEPIYHITMNLMFI